MQPPGQKPASHVRAGIGGAADANGDAPHLACAGSHGGEVAIAVGADVSPVAPTTPEARPCSAAPSGAPPLTVHGSLALCLPKNNFVSSGRVRNAVIDM